MVWRTRQALTAVEVDALLAEIKKRAGKQDSKEESPILQQFRDLTQNDDGREYYMVNLLKFRKKRFTRKAVPLAMTQ
ncbi:MAG: hypothetical protein IPG80_00875 [Anaerolineales bacterium]|uniref:hypothetical protein n=1 Tax=Candidatus Villigracilis vicinus TaxID=3140679 RepID=UPI003136B6C6|nr:hypothetical protein [Anaerolineales bacterium]